MSEDSPTYAIANEQGVIRYDWPNIQLLWTAGATAADIARSMTRDCPEEYDKVRNTVAVRAARNEWAKTAEDARKLVSGQTRAITDGFQKTRNALSTDVIGQAANIALQHKNAYVSRVSAWGDKVSSVLEQQQVTTMDQVQTTAIQLKPAHDILKDIHGLNARENSTQVNFNMLSDSGMVTLDMEQPDKDK